MDEDEKIGAVFAANVVTARENRNMTGTELSEALEGRGVHLSPVLISRIESGNRMVKIGEAAVIAQVLRVDLAEMVQEHAPSDTIWLTGARTMPNFNRPTQLAALTDQVLAEVRARAVEALSRGND